MVKNLIILSGNLNKTAADETGEGPSFEQQFGILANAQITDKYPILSNYQISVQLLDKSDDNSFAACAVVYKLGSEYIYVPAVYRNGKISTGLIMLVPSMSMFLPLSDAWMSWIKNKDVDQAGLAIEPDMKSSYGQPASTARAREPGDPIMKNASLFDTTLKLGKKASEKLLDMLNQPLYLNEAFKFYSPLEINNFAKQASLKYPEEAEVEVIGVLDKCASQLTEEQKQALYTDGFLVKKAEKVDWGDADNDIKVIRSTNVSKCFRKPTEACECQILLQDGSLKDVTYIPNITSINRSCECDGYLYPDHRISTSRTKWDASSLKFLKDTKTNAPMNIIVEGNTWKEVSEDIAALLSSIKKLDKFLFGKALDSMDEIPYDAIIILPCGCCISTFCGSFKKDSKTGEYFSYDTIINITEDDTLTKPVITKGYIEIPKGCRVLLNAGEYNSDGSKKDLKERTFSVAPVRMGDLSKALQRFDRTHTSKIKVTSDGQEVTVTGAKSDSSKRMQKTEAVLHLVKDYGIAPKDAKTILKNAGAATIDNPKTDSYLLYKEAEYEESKLWEPANIGMTEESNNPPEITTQDLTGYALNEMTPLEEMQTIQTAADSGVKEVFDTQTLKLLIQTADPREEIMEALPDFMVTLDKLCRLLFIYRSHMLDMELSYGAVKMKALLKSLQNTIKDLSELTIFLKLRGLKEGQSPDAGDLQTGTLMQ